MGLMFAMSAVLLFGTFLRVFLLSFVVLLVLIVACTSGRNYNSDITYCYILALALAFVAIIAGKICHFCCSPFLPTESIRETGHT